MRTGSAIALAFVLAAGIAARTQEIEPITFDPTDGKWILLQARIDAHAPMLTACALASACRTGPAMEQWHTLVGEAARRRGTARLAYVNAAVNRIVHWRSDHDNYGLDDYWAMPIETLMRGGDCEDFAILKYALLAASGVPEPCLRIVVGQIKSIAGNQDHAWLALFRDGVWHALDCKFDSVIAVADYLNWLPVAAVHAETGVIYGREFSIAEILGG